MPGYVSGDDVVVRFGSDVDDYVRGLDQAEQKFMHFAHTVSTAKIPSLDDVMGMSGGTNKFTQHVDVIVGQANRLTAAAATVSKAYQDIGAAMGMGPSSPLFGQAGSTRGASPAELDAIKRLRNVQLGLPPDGGPLRGRPSFARTPFDFNTGGLAGRGGGGGGRGRNPYGDEDEGFRWNWMSSIIGGIGGRTFGGHLAGLGGMLGGGVGGPFGAVAGIAGGMAIHGMEVVFDKVRDAAVSAFSAIVSGSIEAARYAVKLGMEYERVLTAFRVLTGSRAVGENLFANIQQLGINTPYTTRQLAGEAQTLLGYGVESRNMIPVLSRLGDIAGGDPERLGRLSLAYGQVLSHGRLQGQELRQFAEAGVGVEDFAQTAGMTGRQFKTTMQTIGVDADVMINTINRLTNAGGRFAGMSQEQMKTVSGAWSNLVERVEIFAGKFGMQGMQKLNIAGNINELADDLASVNQYGEQFVDWLGRAKTALDPFGTAFNAIKNDAAGIFDGVFGTDKKWEDLGDTITNWATDVVAAFLMLKATVQATYNLIMTGPRGVKIGMDLAEIAIRADPMLNKALGKTKLTDVLFPAGSAGGIVSDVWDNSKEMAATMMAEARKERMNNRIRRTGVDLVPGFGEIASVGKFLAGQPADIPRNIRLDAETASYTDKIAADFKVHKGHPFDIFNRGMGLISKAENFGKDMANPLMGGLAAGMGGILGALSKEQADFGRLKLYHELAQSVGAERVGMAPAAAQGSQAAQDIINQNQTQQTNVLMQVLEVLTEAKAIADEQKRIEQQQLDALNMWQGKGL